MLTKSSEPRQPNEEFQRFFREASAIMFNIQCLEGILKPVSAGDWAYLKPMMGETMVLRRNEELPVSVELSWQIIHGVSILKPLAAELYLKALIAATRRVPPRVHDLSKLVNKLNSKEQTQLDELFAKHFGLRANPRVPHVQHPNFRSVMEAHKNDFVDVRYGETVESYLRRTQDGMTNISAAVDALREACLLHPAAASWMQGQQRVLQEES